MATKNLNEVAAEITRTEGLGKSVGIAQVKEILGILGARWRAMTLDEIHAEVDCIIERAGLMSGHRD